MNWKALLHVRALTLGILVFLALNGLRIFLPHALAQQGFVKGKAYEKKSQKPISLVSVFLTENSVGGESDSSGVFVIGPIKPGQYSLNASHLGFRVLL